MKWWLDIIDRLKKGFSLFFSRDISSLKIIRGLGLGFCSGQLATGGVSTSKRLLWLHTWRHLPIMLMNCRNINFWRNPWRENQILVLEIKKKMKIPRKGWFLSAIKKCYGGNDVISEEKVSKSGKGYLRPQRWSVLLFARCCDPSALSRDAEGRISSSAGRPAILAPKPEGPCSCLRAGGPEGSGLPSVAS